MWKRTNYFTLDASFRANICRSGPIPIVWMHFHYFAMNFDPLKTITYVQHLFGIMDYGFALAVCRLTQKRLQLTQNDL